MASLKDIRRRILAVKNTQKVTRAMKLVAAAKLKRAQRMAMEGRAYSEALFETVQRVSRRLGRSAPPLWTRPDELTCIDVLVISSDRGLCGGFNENLMRAMMDGVEDHTSHNIAVKSFIIGKKGLQHAARCGLEFEPVSLGEEIEAGVDAVVKLLVGRFLSGESSGCNLAFNRFISAAKQKITFWNLLPLYYRGTEAERNLEYLYEPTREEALRALCEEALRNSIRQALRESAAAELAARMAAMDGATKNADEMIAHLTSVYNRARQETITSELLDIVNGAEALK